MVLEPGFSAGGHGEGQSAMIGCLLSFWHTMVLTGGSRILALPILLRILASKLAQVLFSPLTGLRDLSAWLASQLASYSIHG